MKVLNKINIFILLGLLLVSCTTSNMTAENEVLNKGGLVSKTKFDDKSVEKVDQLTEKETPVVDTSNIAQVSEANILDNVLVTDYSIRQGVGENLSNILDLTDLSKATTSLTDNNEISMVPSYLFGGWIDDDTGNMFGANFDYDFSHVFISNEVLENRIFIIGDNCKIVKKNWLGTLDGSIVINNKIGTTNVGKNISFDSGLDDNANYYFKINFDDSSAQYSGTFEYDVNLDSVKVHMIVVDIDGSKSEFDYNLIRAGYPILGANTFNCPDWLDGYAVATDDYDLSFNDGMFEINARNSSNQTIDISFDEFNKKLQGDVALNEDNNFVIQMYGEEEQENIDLDFFYILDERLNNFDGYQGVLTLQIIEKTTGVGGIIQVAFIDREVKNLGIYFLQEDGSFIPFF